ncbi:MAG TPA: hypothetical protein VLA56_22785, partial [Pseudomonadales bacterium]|nr:hypothetical protein [Pseudomonadales bacterium]
MTFSRFLYGAACLALVFAGCARDSRVDGPLAPPSDAQPLVAGPSGGDCAHMTQHYMSTTTDFGQSFVPVPTPVQRTLSLTWGLAALDDAGTLVMQADDELWGSENDGCSWVQIRAAVDTKDARVSAGPTPAAEGIFRVTAAGQGYAYAWQDNGGRILRVRHGGSVQSRWEVVALRAPISNMKGFGIDPADPMHVRTAGNDGQIFESFDGGASWRTHGVAASRGIPLGYVIAFDAADFDHAVYGRVIEGGYVTFDGGASWTPCNGLASVAGASVNLFNAVISPLDGNTVFAM